MGPHTGSLVLVTVTAAGRLRVDADGAAHDAVLLDDVATVQAGQGLRMRLGGPDGAMELWGEVAPGAEAAPLREGLRFSLNVRRLSRGAAGLAVDPVPSVVEDSSPAGVCGNLRHMPLSDVLQSLENGQRTALVEVRPRSGSVGTITVESGRVMDVTCGELRGVPAFLELIHQHRGSFFIHYGVHPRGEALDLSITWMLLEAMRRQDEPAAAGEQRCLWNFVSLHAARVFKGLEEPFRRSTPPGVAWPWTDSGSFPPR